MVRRRRGNDYYAFWLLFNYATSEFLNCQEVHKYPKKILEILVGCYDFDEENKVLTKQKKIFLLRILISLNMFPRRPSHVIRYGEILLGRFPGLPPDLKVEVLQNLGDAYQSCAQHDKSEEYLKKSLRIAKGLRAKQQMAYVYIHLGLLYRNKGQFDNSMKNLEEALTLSKEIFYDNGIAEAYRALGSVYSTIGKDAEAQQYIEKALRIHEKAGRDVLFGRCLHDLGNTYKHRDKNEKACGYYMKALKIASDLGDKEGEDRVCSSLGTIHKKERKFEEAIHYHERSLKITRDLDDRRGESISNNNLGNVYAQMCLTRKATEHIERALRVAMNEDSRDMYGGKLYSFNLGCIYFFDGEYTSACEKICKSISLGDKLRNDFKQRDQFNMSMAKQDFKAHSYLTTILLMLGYTKKALLVLDVGRSKSLYDLLRLSSNRMDKNLLESQSVKWIEEIPSIIDEPTKDGCAEICENVFLTMESGSILYFGFDIAGIVLFIWVLTPHGIFLREWSPPHRSSAKEFLRRVSSRFHDAVTPSRCYPGFEDARNSVREKYVKILRELPDEIENNLDRFQIPKDVLSGIKSKDPSEAEDDRRESGVLDFEEKADAKVASRGEDSHQMEIRTKLYLSAAYQALISPVEDILTGSKLVIVPDDWLFLLPFFALLNKDGKPLCDRYSIQITPALHTLNFSLSIPMKPLGPAVCVGNPPLYKVHLQGEVIDLPKLLPPLPSAEKEATECATYFDAKPLLGKQATKKKVLQKMKNASVIHIAAHGNTNYGEIFLAPNPEAPSTPREEHYLLMPEDISECSLAARLVVLSCCFTGRGEISSEGVVGTARAFLGAGARAVLVALWALPDEETREFMRMFYDNVCVGLSVCVALQQAMKTFKEKDDRMQVWAPFEIFGEDVTITGEDLKEIRRLSREGKNGKSKRIP